MDRCTERTPRVAAARRLRRRAGRQRAGRFLVEGAQAVEEALAWSDSGHGRVHELFTVDPEHRLAARAVRAGIPVSVVTERAAAELSETVTPQGLVAVCDLLGTSLAGAIRPGARLVLIAVGTADPGNAGTLIRVADAAGADAVVFTGSAVDPHNGKSVRACTGSLFHLPVVCEPEPDRVVAHCRAAGLQVLAADGAAALQIECADLGRPTAWAFGSEAHGLDPDLLGTVDAGVRVPIYGAAESLNLATAAAVCLYSSARALHASQLRDR